MPIDFGHHFSQWTHGCANNNIIGDVTTNPLLFSVILTLLIFTILYMVGWSQDDYPSMKLTFYILSGIIGLNIIRDSFMKSRWKETSENLNQSTIVTNVLNNEADESVAPREDEVVTKELSKTIDANGGGSIATEIGFEQLNAAINSI